MYLVRHGQTEWNAEMRMQGQKNSQLTTTGIEQAQAVAKSFEQIHFDAVYSSDLLRAKHTAEIIKLNRELDTKTSEFLRERSYGRFEGKAGTEYRQFVDSQLEKIQQLNEKERWEYKLEADIESNAELMARFVTYLREIALAHAGQTVLVVSHGGPMRILLIHLGYLSDQQAPPGLLENGAHIELESDGITFEVKQVVGLREAK